MSVPATMSPEPKDTLRWLEVAGMKDGASGGVWLVARRAEEARSRIVARYMLSRDYVTQIPDLCVCMEVLEGIKPRALSSSSRWMPRS